MNVYQVIKNEYNSDDGHYDSTPESETVYAREDDAITLRNHLNARSVDAHNTHVNEEIARRTAQWEANGRVENPPVNRHGTQYHDPYGPKGMKQYADRYTFRGDPTNVEDLERFANRDTDLTFYTIDTLTVFQ